MVPSLERPMPLYSRKANPWGLSVVSGQVVYGGSGPTLSPGAVAWLNEHRIPLLVHDKPGLARLLKDRAARDIERVAVSGGYHVHFSKLSIAPLVALPKLRELRLRHCSVVDLPAIVGSRLETLELEFKLTPDDLATVAAATQLRALSLEGKVGRRPINDKDLKGLARLPALEELALREAGIGAAGVGLLAGCKGLRYLSLRKSSVGDDAIPALRSLPALTWLDVAWTSVTDVGLAALAGSPSLEVLDLRWNRGVTDLSRLGDLPRLRRLDLSSTSVTDGRALAAFPGLLDLGFGETGVDDTALPVIGGLTALERLSLHGTRITNAGLSHLSGLGRLRELSVAETEVTDTAPLARLPALEELELWRSKLTDAGLAGVRGLPRLRKLHLWDTVVTATGLGHVRDLPALVLLDLAQTRVDTVAALGELPRLAELRLESTPIADDGLRDLARFPTLRGLGLAKTSITDGAMDHVLTLPDLVQLDLRHTAVTDAGVARLAGLGALEAVYVTGSGVTNFAALGGRLHPVSPMLVPTAVEDP